MGRRVNVIGVGMTKFAKPGASEDYNVMATKAARAALEDAKVDLRRRRAGVRRLRLRRQHLRAARRLRRRAHRHPRLQREQQLLHRLDRALPRPARPSRAASPSACWWSASRRWRRARSAPSSPIAPTRSSQHAGVMNKVQGFTQAPPAAQMFGGAGREYRWKYGTKRETFAKVASKARKHAANNPYALFNQQLTVEEVLASDEVFDPLTRYQCCPPTCGAAAAILCSDDFARKQGHREARLHRRPGDDDRLRVQLQGRQHDQDGRLRHGPRGREEGLREVRPRPRGRRRHRAARLLHHQRGAHLRGARPLQGGRGREVHRDGDNTYGGKFVTNPSGGLLSKGHPLGATGLAQCTELVWQLRGQADKRQVDGRQGRAPAQPRPRRRLRRHDVPARTETSPPGRLTGPAEIPSCSRRRPCSRGPSRRRSRPPRGARRRSRRRAR